MESSLMARFLVGYGWRLMDVVEVLSEDQHVP